MFGLFKKKEVMWEKFRGKGNSDEMLVQKGEAIGGAIGYLSEQTTNSLIQTLQGEGKDINSREVNNLLFFETIALLVHLTDRVSFNIVGPEKREVFIDAVVNYLIQLISHDYEEDDKREIELHFRNHLDKRQNEYANYQIPESSDEAMKDTLYWEASKNIAGVLGGREDLMNMMTVQTVVGGSFPFLEVKEILTI